MSSKFNQMFNFISLYKYEINKKVPDNLKCEQCKNVLNNAYCVPCGCSYCCDCMNELIENGVENCPGKTEDCKDELLLNNHLDCKANKSISNFVIKCPEEMCVFECAIINMGEHVRVCEENVKCPFADLGCDGRSAGEIINDHCQSANFNHCKILIEIIDNLRNEIGISNDNDKRNQLKIENLERNLISKNEIIKKINEEIELIKISNETANRNFQLFTENLSRNVEEIDDKMKRDKENMKIEHDQKLNELNDNFERKTKEIFTEVQKKSETMETKIKELNKIIDKIRSPIIEWKIDKLDEKKKKDECILSDYFTTIIIKQYKLQLSFWANGCDYIYGKGFSIYLWIYPGANDQFLSWPFIADVTIKIMSKTNSNTYKSITKYCKIDKPINIRNSSESFNYLYSDLTKNGEVLDNSFIIECFVDFK